MGLRRTDSTIKQEKNSSEISEFPAIQDYSLILQMCDSLSYSPYCLFTLALMCFSPVARWQIKTHLAPDN